MMKVDEIPIEGENIPTTHDVATRNDSAGVSLAVHPADIVSPTEVANNDNNANDTNNADNNDNNNNNNNIHDSQKAILEAYIRESTIRAKFGYFILYMGLSASPYYGLLLENKGFTPAAVGSIMAFMPLCVLLLLPPLSFMADRYHCALNIFLCATSVSAVLYFTVTMSSSHVIIAILMVLHYVFRTPVGPFMDQRTMSILPPERKVQWGAMRSFGAYGWAVGALFNSILYSWEGWWAVALLLLVSMCITMYMFITIVPHELTQSAKMNYLDVLRYVSSHRRLTTFLAALCFMGLGYSLINTFLFIFLNSINAPPVLLGISIVMTVVVEIPLFQCSKYVHEHYDDRQLLCVSMCAWSIRVMGYSILHNPWLVLFLEPLHGFTFGLMWLSGMHFVRGAFPKSLSHSSVGFLSATAFGVGPLIGNIVGGALYNYFGGRWMFRIMSICMLCVAIVFAVVDIHLERRGFSVEAVEAEEEARDVVVENVNAASPEEFGQVVERTVTAGETGEGKGNSR
ncbi:Major facilitator superfamily associated domain [Trypanosoma melophagium]|uniref:Major facilitator superfamily associated domain n=1 Tax=Trypanosoma melophagium TaxID=715481 RepID=UPI003519F956|nr:Major facilitator superfamily associated domain [Trypanosoma melophagium]